MEVTPLPFNQLCLEPAFFLAIFFLGTQIICINMLEGVKKLMVQDI